MSDTDRRCDYCIAKDRDVCPDANESPPALPLVSLDDPDLTRAVAEAIDLRWQRRTTFGNWTELAQDAAEAALAAVRAHLDEVGRP